MSSEQINGYTVAYEREELAFPVYLLAVIAFALLAGGIYKSLPLLVILGFVPLTGFYYNLPLLETGRWRIAAGQYGFVLEGLGLIDWRAIDGIDLVTKDDRGSSSSELYVELKVPVAKALILDWRRRSFLRSLMRLPWSWAAPRKIRVPLDIMDKPPAEIHSTLQRMWRYYRGQQPPPILKSAT